METTTVNTVVKNNELIAEFMGLTPVKCFGKYSISKDHCTSSQDTPEEALKGFGSIAKYQTSWDWLMPVVDKCTQTGDDTSQWDDLADALTTINIENTYQAVVEFIQWYNKIK